MYPKEIIIINTSFRHIHNIFFKCINSASILVKKLKIEKLLLFKNKWYFWKVNEKFR